MWSAINVLDAAYAQDSEFQPRTLSIVVQDKSGVLNEVRPGPCMGCCLARFARQYIFLLHAQHGKPDLHADRSVGGFLLHPVAQLWSCCFCQEQAVLLVHDNTYMHKCTDFCLFDSTA